MDRELSGCVHCASTWSELMSCVTSLTAATFKESSMLLSGFSSPICCFFAKIMSSGLVFIIVCSSCTGNKYWHNKEILLWPVWD